MHFTEDRQLSLYGNKILWRHFPAWFFVSCELGKARRQSGPQCHLMGHLSGDWWNLSCTFLVEVLVFLSFFNFPASQNIFQSNFLAAWHLYGMYSDLQQVPATLRRGWHISAGFATCLDNGILYKNMFSPGSFVCSRLGKQGYFQLKLCKKHCDEKCNLEKNVFTLAALSIRSPLCISFFLSILRLFE